MNSVFTISGVYTVLYPLSMDCNLVIWTVETPEMENMIVCIPGFPYISGGSLHKLISGYNRSVGHYLTYGFSAIQEKIVFTVDWLSSRYNGRCVYSSMIVVLHSRDRMAGGVCLRYFLNYFVDWFLFLHLPVLHAALKTACISSRRS